MPASRRGSCATTCGPCSSSPKWPIALRRDTWTNALRYTPTGGTITLAAETGASGACALRVSDTGFGIAPEHLPKLFDRFYQVEPDRSRSLAGMGLGLALVKSIMDLHGGGVEVCSAPSRGSTFTLYFPAQPTVKQAPT